ncbi:ferritin-like domain-containing protein [Halomarina salina]|uniref:Ferritin-like domain-containing protein n=1 Tax=Halomarina salina TaxID=1872699 RepID=A0ABD5RRN2_9EURY|nr:ferritin-like domain-containing protein [Halomarina salina]
MTDDNTPVDRVIDGANELLTDRRSFMAGAAKLGVGGALLSQFASGSATAQEGDEMSEVSDLDILNYALTLEHLEYSFYEEGLSNFEELRDFERAGTPGGEIFDDPSLQYGTYNYLESVRDHEEAHVHTLTETIEKLGGDPVGAAEYQFPYETPEEFVALALTLENVGVSAYAGAGPLIQNEAVVEAALSIHSVEARHAAFLGTLNERLFPHGAFDPARSMDEVVAIASQFIVSE